MTPDIHILVTELAALNIGPRMSARILGCSVAYVAQIRQKLKLKHRTLTSKDVIESLLSNDLRHRCEQWRELHKRTTEQA